MFGRTRRVFETWIVPHLVLVSVRWSKIPLHPFSMNEGGDLSKECEVVRMTSLLLEIEKVNWVLSCCSIFSMLVETKEQLDMIFPVSSKDGESSCLRMVFVKEGGSAFLPWIVFDI